MKKKIFSLVAISAISLGVWSYSENQNNVEFSDLALENIEALANREGGSCDNVNGYRRILDESERIYDCCYKEKMGKGRTNCQSL